MDHKVTTDALVEPRLFIDGEFVEADGGRTYADINPASAEAIAEVADAGVADMDRAITAARHAFDELTWSRDRAFRKRCLLQLHDALEGHKEELREVIVAEAGTPIALTYGPQLQMPIDDFLYDIEMIDSFEWSHELPNRDGRPRKRFVVREPIGVVGAITPWNFPFALNLWKIGPALAAGNTVVLKAAPDTPLVATALARLVADETDIPAGVFNVIASADKAATGEVLTSDPRVDMITFTGSASVGRRVLESASQSIKKVVLELGGKSANIVCEDANLETVMQNIATTTCYHAGQGCVLTMRTMVPRAIYDDAVDALEAALSKVPWGDPLDMANVMGPLASQAQLDRVLGYISVGRDEGARLVAGGDRADSLGPGFYVEPTLFADADASMRIAREEIFGPVQTVIPVGDVDEAVELSNASRYGLGGAVFSSSDDRAFEIAKRLRVGTVSVNGVGGGGPDAPFGGYRESGLGREHGVEGFGEFLEVKTLGRPAS